MTFAATLATIRAGALGLMIALAAPAAAADGCATGDFEGTPFTACVFDPGRDDIRLFYRDNDGTLIGSFSALSSQLEGAGKTLALAMNGGMYHPDRRPVGLYIEDGRELAPLVLSDGPGNFGLLPNGVFCVGPSGARVMESRAFAKASLPCRHATQSGPLLVEGGKLHPRFLPDSSSRFIRNGVGVRPDGAVVFAISDAPVTFHRFARLFRDELGTPDALYIDGRVSRLHAPELGRSDIGLPLGPILGVVRPAD